MYRLLGNIKKVVGFSNDVCFPDQSYFITWEDVVIAMGKDTSLSIFFSNLLPRVLSLLIRPTITPGGKCIYLKVYLLLPFVGNSNSAHLNSAVGEIFHHQGIGAD